MSVEICVSSEELKKTLEYMALIGAAGIKKKDADETAGAMRITAVSPKRDYRYMLMFCRMGAAEQLVYRMEGKSRNSNEPVDAYVDGKRFIALAKTFSGDVHITFAGNEVVLTVGRTEYNLPTVVTKMPDLKVPDGGVEISAKFLEDAMKHCAPVIDKNAPGVRGGIKFKVEKDGSAVCWAFQSFCAARYAVPSAGGVKDLEITLLPADIQRVATLADGDEIRLISTPNGNYFTSLRFDYMCFCLQGVFPDCEAMQAKFKELKRVSVSKQELLAALNRCCVVAGDNGNIQLYTLNNDLVLEASGICGNGLEYLAANDVKGQDDSVNYLNAQALLRIVFNCPGDSITIISTGKLSAYYIASSGSPNHYLLMSRRGGV